MYKIGMYVSYRSEGVCVISEIRRQKFGALNELKDFYILSPVREPNAKLFVPSDNESLVKKMRPLCSADEVNSLMRKLLDQRFEWIAQPRPRANFFREILADGNRDSLVTLVHTVCDKEAELSQIGKHVTQSDLSALERAKKMLLLELSFTTDITTEQMLTAVINCECNCKDK